MICPTCGGEGHIVQKQSRRADNNTDLPNHYGMKYKVRKCIRCNGTGECSGKYKEMSEEELEMSEEELEMLEEELELWW